jgi:hypothetical protein
VVAIELLNNFFLTVLNQVILIGSILADLVFRIFILILRAVVVLFDLLFLSSNVDLAILTISAGLVLHVPGIGLP